MAVITPHTVTTLLFKQWLNCSHPCCLTTVQSVRSPEESVFCYFLMPRSSLHIQNVLCFIGSNLIRSLTCMIFVCVTSKCAARETRMRTRGSWWTWMWCWRATTALTSSSATVPLLPTWVFLKCINVFIPNALAICTSLLEPVTVVCSFTCTDRRIYCHGADGNVCREAEEANPRPHSRANPWKDDSGSKWKKPTDGKL